MNLTKTKNFTAGWFLKIALLIGLALAAVQVLHELGQTNATNIDVNFESHETLKLDGNLRTKLAAVKHLLSAGEYPLKPVDQRLKLNGTSNRRLRDLGGIASLPCMGCDLSEKLLSAYNKVEGRKSKDYFRAVYLELVKYTVTGYNVKTNSEIRAIRPMDDKSRFRGHDWPEIGYAMTGIRRLTIVQQAIEQVLKDKIPGDFIECGVWRGGTSITARATLLAHGVNDRIVYVADSFRGLPKPRINVGEPLWKYSILSVSVERVKDHFRRMYVYDPDKVKFIVGFFNESMPVARQHIKVLSVLRLDGDLYESCFDVLNNMYDKLSVGGYVLIDDWTGFTCKAAIIDFKKAVNSPEHVEDTPGEQGGSWRKTIAVKYDPAELYQLLIVPRLLNKNVPITPNNVSLYMPKSEDIPELECRGCAATKKVLQLHSDNHDRSMRALFVETLKAAVGGYSVRTNSFDVGFGANKKMEFNDEQRYNGSHVSVFGYTKMGLLALDALHYLLSHVINADVLGDFLDIGIGQGGASIFAASVFTARFQPTRSILMMDWFNTSSQSQVNVNLPLLKDSFRRFFIYPKDNIYLVSIEDAQQEAPLFDNKLSAIRLDVCAFDQTTTSAVLAQVYDRLSSGGLVILDSWRSRDDPNPNHCAGGARAVQNFRQNAAATTQLKATSHPWVGYWIKP